MAVEITQEHIDTAKALYGKGLPLCDLCVMTQAVQPLFAKKINTGSCYVYVCLEDDVETITAVLSPAAKKVVTDFDLHTKEKIEPQIVTIDVWESGMQYLSELGRTRLVNA